MKQLILLIFSLLIFAQCSSSEQETDISSNSQNRATPSAFNKNMTPSPQVSEKNEVQNNDSYQDSIVPTDPNADYFVINLQGAKIYNQPSFNAKVLSTLENGKGIQQKYLHQLQGDKLKINEGITLEGYWLMIDEPTQGYIFSTDFSKRRPLVKHYLMNIISLLGEQIGETTYSKKPCKIKNEVFEIDIETTHFKNTIYKYESFDGCFDHFYTFKDMEFHEVYHHTMNQYSDFYNIGNEIKIDSPIFKKVNGNGEVLYEGTDATIDLIFKKKTNGEYETYSYDCT